MIISARVNNEKIYSLVRWSSLDFNANLTLYIQSIDLEDIRDTFEEITKLEIFQDDVPVAVYTSLDTFSQITYLGKEFVEGEKKFADAMSVTLTKANIVDQVQRLDETINGVVDPNTLGLQDLREYVLEQISKECQADIFAGETVVLPNGDREHFRWTIEDQLDVKALYDLVMANPTVECLPMHPTGGSCKTYSRQEIITIYATLMLRLTRLTTYANQLNMYVRTINDRDILLGIRYGMELPEPYATTMAQIMAITITEVGKILGDITSENDEQPEVPEESSSEEELEEPIVEPDEPGENEVE